MAKTVLQQLRAKRLRNTEFCPRSGVPVSECAGCQREERNA